MEDIINKIIDIDNKAKSIVFDEKEKKKNIEEFIENEFKTKKVVLDLEFKDELKMQKEKYAKMFEEKKIQIENLVQSEIEKVEENYRSKENTIINTIINDIKLE